MDDTKEKHALQIVINEAEISALGDNDKVVLKAVEITKANARLIAAAPEMYEVLREILAPCPVKGYQGKYDRRRTYNARKKAREVLAKVEGGEG